MIKTRNSTWYLYRITCCVDGVGDYFGITTRPKEREDEHRRGKNKAKIRDAIRLYGQEKFTYVIISSFNNELDARIAEFDHIKRFNTGWPNGLNVMSAGKGVYSDDAYRETYKRRCEAQKLAMTEKRRKASSERVKKWLADPEKKAAAREKIKAWASKPEHRALAAEYAKMMRHTEAINKAHSKLMKSLWASGALRGHRGRTVDKMSEEERVKISKRTKKYFSDPEKAAAFQKRIKEAWSGPKGEERKKKLRERWSNPNFKEHSLRGVRSKRPDYSDPEIKKHMCAAQQLRQDRARAERNLLNGHVEGSA